MTYAERTAGAVARVGASDVAAGWSRIATAVLATVCSAGVIGGVAMYGTQQSIQAEVAANSQARISATMSLQQAIDANTSAISLLTNWLRSSDVADARAAEQIKALNHRIDTMAQRQKEGFARIERSLSQLSGPS